MQTLQKSALVAGIFSVAALGASAEPLQGMSFTHGQWEISCDNTGTCRAAGYKANDEGDTSISILFTRTAGANAQVEGKLNLQTEDGKNPNQAELFLNSRSLGPVRFSSQEKSGKLSAAQTQALLAALKRSSRIEARFNGQTAVLSDQGAAAVLLKMDDFQKRVGTPSALVRKGNSTQAVLQPQPKPVVHIPKLPQQKELQIPVGDPRHAKLLALIKKAPTPDARIINQYKYGDEACDQLFDTGEYGLAKQNIVVYPLDGGKRLIEAGCWQGAYNFGMIYLVTDNAFSRVYQNVGPQFNRYMQGGVLSGSHKGRGLGDCWSGSTAAWNGSRFVTTSVYDTGMCRGFPGGAWHLPQFEAEVQNANDGK